MKTVNPEWSVPDSSIETMLEDLDEFLDPYLKYFGRRETHRHARMYLEGRMQTNMRRRTMEPITMKHDVPRRPLQMFVGAGVWKDEPVLLHMRGQVAEELGSSDGVLIMDGSGMEKFGTESVGVKRQWCGRLGKVENCQKGEFLCYSSHKGYTLVGQRLYLPSEWASDRERRAKTHIPQEVKFQKGWELAYDMVLECSPLLPHEWILGDDEYGRVVELRRKLDDAHERYLLDVPCNTHVWRTDNGKSQTVESIGASIPKKEWWTVRTRDGEKGPLRVRATKLRVFTGKGDERRRETLLIVRRPSTGEVWYHLSNATGFSVKKMAKVAACRYDIEASFKLAKTEVGLDEYEVRSWVGWNHHMTLSMLALFFVVRERIHLKKRHQL